jgi:bifunctional non-homologous end joining protein LigD
MPARAKTRERERHVEIDGRELRLRNLDKVMYPHCGFTKGDVVEYYDALAPVLVPHLRGRPITLKRWPDGIDAGFFYEKQCPRHRPDWVQTRDMPSERSGVIHYCTVDDRATLAWLANLATLELHPLLMRAPHLDRPTALVFDLDPGPPAGVLDAGRVALVLRDLLDDQDYEPLVKTSGGKGIHVLAPLPRPTTFQETKGFAHAVAQALERARDDVVSSMRKELRRGKVLVDWSQNDEHKSTVAPYSLRARETNAGPSVSTPIRWTELEAAIDDGDADALTFTPADVLARVEADGDLHAALTGTSTAARRRRGRKR